MNELKPKYKWEVDSKKRFVEALTQPETTSRMEGILNENLSPNKMYTDIENIILKTARDSKIKIVKKKTNNQQ